MRTLQMILAPAGAVTAGAGVAFSIGIALMIGVTLLVIAMVMGAPAAPSTRRGR